MRTRSLHLPSLLAAALVALSACGDERTGITAPPARPTSELDDGSRGGNPNFFFLPPLVANPVHEPEFDAGAFVGSWKPVVQICRLATPTTCEQENGGPKWLRTFEGSEVRVSASEELYKVEWNTRETWATTGSTYRARVILVGHTVRQLGFIDISLLGDQRSVKSNMLPDVIPLLDGRTVPIKFRIERGAAVDPTTVDYVEAVVTDAGGTVTTEEGDAGIFLGDGWLPEGVNDVVVTVQRVDPPGEGNDCHGLGVDVPWLKQFEGCYRVETFPAIGVLQADAVFAVCTESPLVESQVMYKSDPDGEGGRRVKALRNVTLPEPLQTALDCEGFGGIAAAPRSGSMRDLLQFGARRVMAGIGRAIAPKPAYALDLGQGGELRGFVDDLSDFGWAVPVVIGQGAGDGQSAVAGQALAERISVRVMAAHDHDEDPVYIDGVPVTFTVSGGSIGGLSAAVTSVTVNSNADGFAEAPAWTLPSTPGDYTMTVTIPDDRSNNPDAVPQHRMLTFTATATSAGSIVITDLQTGADIGEAVQVVANSRRAWNAVLSSPTGACQVTPATADDVMDAFFSATEGGTRFNIEARTPGVRTVTVTCGSATRSIAVTITEPPTMIAAACTNPAFYPAAGSGDNVTRGFYIANYPQVQLAGADLRFGAAVEGSYTIRLTARYGSFLGPVIGTGTATMLLGPEADRQIGAFRWPSATVPPDATVAFSLTVLDAPEGALLSGILFDVANSFDGDPECPFIETTGTGSEAQPLDQVRRRGVRAILYGAFERID